MGDNFTGPWGAGLDALARRVGGWSHDQMVYAIEVIGDMDAPDPQIMLTGSKAKWMPRAKRWSFKGHPPVKAVVRHSEYTAAIKPILDAARALPNPDTEGQDK